MDLVQDPNQWILTLGSGIIVTVVGGFILHSLFGSQGVKPLGCSYNAKLFLCFQVIIVMLYGVFALLAQDPSSGQQLEGLAIFCIIATIANILAAVIGYENWEL